MNKYPFYLCLLIVATCICSSCSTIKTISPRNNHVTIEYFGHISYCEEIPRVYSGLASNFCLLYGEPNESGITVSSPYDASFFIIDSCFSAIADTVVLPYTVLQQMEKGSIEVN